MFSHDIQELVCGIDVAAVLVADFLAIEKY